MSSSEKSVSSWDIPKNRKLLDKFLSLDPRVKNFFQCVERRPRGVRVRREGNRSLAKEPEDILEQPSPQAGATTAIQECLTIPPDQPLPVDFFEPANSGRSINFVGVAGYARPVTFVSSDGRNEISGSSGRRSRTDRQY